MHRRSSDDLEWKKVCKQVDERDKRMCRFSRCLTAGEEREFLKGGNAGMHLDHAHVYEVSFFPEEYTNLKNIYLINRTVHSKLDHFQDPLTGYPSNTQHHSYWWWRIINLSTERFDESKDYESLVREYIIEVVDVEDQKK
jgi:hypothetical protein